MLRIHDFECRECRMTFEALVDRDDRTLPCSLCWGVADRLISAPALHTLETHMRGFHNEGSDGHYNPAFGEFRDENIVDRKTGKAATYSSPKEKEKALEAHGLFQKEPKRKRRTERPMFFTSGTNKRSQLG